MKTTMRAQDLEDHVSAREGTNLMNCHELSTLLTTALVLALLAVTSSHAAVWPGENKDTIKMVAKDKWRHPSKQLKGKDTAQGRFSQYKNGEFSFEPHFAWSMKVPPRSVESIEMNPPAWTAVILKNKKEQRMLLKSFSTDTQGRQNFVFVKNGKEIEIPLKDVAALEIVVDFSLRFPDPLPTPTAAQVKAANSYTLTKGSTWLHSGIVGPLGVTARRRALQGATDRHLRPLEYRILKIAEGSPAYGRLLRGDVIIGLNGCLFQLSKYANRRIESFKAGREPDWEMGRAIHEAYGKGKGDLTLTVYRGGRRGTVTLNIGSKKPLSPTYPWNCVRSEQLCREIAENYVNNLHGKLGTWQAGWYGLFLMNYDPKAYRSAIDGIAKGVLDKIDNKYDVKKNNWIWCMSFEAIFLAEYAMMTNQSRDLQRGLNGYARLLLGSRMGGFMWGHKTRLNYGRRTGDFVGASCQAALALVCLQEAGADVPEMQEVLYDLSTATRGSDGRAQYLAGRPSKGVLPPYNWSYMERATGQSELESIMRQGVVSHAMHLAGRMSEAEATYRFLRRQTLVFATHGIHQDLGVFYGAMALASCSPKDCRALLDSYLPRLCLEMRWDGGVTLTPSARGPGGGGEYHASEFGVHQVFPAMTGLLLSMPAKRLYLFSKVMKPGTPPLDWGPRKPRLSPKVRSSDAALPKRGSSPPAAEAKTAAPATGDAGTFFADTVEPTGKGRTRYGRLLQNRIRAMLKAGEKVAFYSSKFRAAMRVTSLDATGTLAMRGVRAPIKMNREWSELTMQDCRSLALAVLREDSKNDNAVVAFYMLATGDIENAPPYLRASGSEQGVLDAFGR